MKLKHKVLGIATLLIIPGGIPILLGIGGYKLYQKLKKTKTDPKKEQQGEADGKS